MLPAAEKASLFCTSLGSCNGVSSTGKGDLTLEILGIAPGSKAEGLIAKLAYKTDNKNIHTQRDHITIAPEQAWPQRRSRN